MRRRAVFLDRDGVLCENRRSYVKTWEEFRWIDGAREALRILARHDIQVVIVTNQSAIGRGLTTLEAVHDLHQRMRRDIEEAGGRLDAIYVCPHQPGEGCRCRKPGLLLFRQSSEEMGLDLFRSYLIGDSLSDLRAGWDLHLRVFLVRTGLGQETVKRLDGNSGQVSVVDNVLEAARRIAADIHTSIRQLSPVTGGEVR